MSPFLKYGPQILLYALICAWFLHFMQPLNYQMIVKRIRAEQRRTIRNRNLEDDEKLLQVSVAALRFERLTKVHKDEISVNGDMYDIVSCKSDGDTVRCLVIKDEGESKVHQQFSKNIDSKHSRVPKTVVFFWVYASANSIELPSAPVFVPLTPETPENSDKPSCGYKRFIGQPPEVFC